jgi:DNA-binding beta-propeller fold protein YncE
MSPVRFRRATPAAVAATLLASAVLAVAGPAGPAFAGTGSPVNPGPYPTVYASSVASDYGAVLTPINTQTDAAGTPIDISNVNYEAGTGALTVSPNGSTIYAVLNSATTGTCSPGDIVPVSTTTGQAGTPIPIGNIVNINAAPETSAFAITPDGDTGYVANTCDGTVTPINLTTDKAGTPITVGAYPDSIAITPDGSTAYVVDSGTDTVTPINLSTNTAEPPITVGNPSTNTPEAIAITPNGATAYVATWGGTVVPVDLATGTPGTPITVSDDESGLSAIAITPNGATAYADSFFDGTVIPVDLATGTAEATITLPDGASPVGIVANPNGSAVYALDWQNGAVYPISTATNALGAAIPTSPADSEPGAIAITPGWSAQATVSQATTADAPALCEFGGSMYAAFTTSGGGIDYVSNSGSGWSAAAPVSGSWGSPDTSWSPALADYDGELQAYWTSAATNDIEYSAYNGSTWSAPQTVSGSWGTAMTNQAPAVAVNGSLLAVTWKGRSTDGVFYSLYNGSGWASQVNTTETTSYAPAVAPLPSAGMPFAFAWTESDNAIGYGALTLDGFEDEGIIPSAATNAGPTLAFAGNLSTNGTLYVAFKGQTNDEVGYEAIFNVATAGLSSSNWTAQEFWTQSGTQLAPALAAEGYVLYSGWTGPSTSHVFSSYAENPF